MFPRISKSTKNGRSYEYLVISESIHVTGKGSTTRNIATLGIKINKIQSEIFKTRKQESNLSKSDEYDTHAKKIFQYDWN